MYFSHLDDKRSLVSKNSDKYIPYEPLPEDTPKDKDSKPFYYYEKDKIKDEQNRYREKINWYNLSKKSPYKPFLWGWIISFIIVALSNLCINKFFLLSEVILFHIFSMFIWVPICSIIAIFNIEHNHRDRVDKRIETPEQRAKDIVDEGIFGVTAISLLKEGGKFVKTMNTPHDKEI